MYAFFKKLTVPTLLTVRDWALLIAEIADAWRFAPRISISAYSYLLWYTIEWFKLLPNPTTQQTTLVSIVAGLAAVIFAFYVNAGRKWSCAPDYVSNNQPAGTMDKDATLKIISEKVDQLSAQLAKQVTDSIPDGTSTKSDGE